MMMEHYSLKKKRKHISSFFLLKIFSHTIFGFAGNLSFILLGASRRISSGSIKTAFVFFCNNFPIVCRPEAGGPIIRIFGTKKKSS